MQPNYVLNGQGHGPVGAAFNVQSRITGGFDPGLLRPFFETDPNSPDNGRPCAQLRTGAAYNNAKARWEPKYEKRTIADWNARGVYSPAFNAVGLTREDWIEIDRAILRATRLPLTAWNDLRAARTRGGFDAWGKLTLEYYATSDAGEVVKDMDATSPARNDLPVNLVRSVPLPVIHGDVDMPQRFIDVTRQGGMPMDAEMIEQLTRRIWESVEKTTIGTEAGVTWGTRSAGPFPQTGTSTEYGYTNFPYRVTKVNLTAPLGTNPEAVLHDVQAMIETMNTNGFFGPFVLYHSTGYSQYLNDDYFRTGSTSAVRSLRERLMELDGISKIARLNYLTTNYTLILIDLNSGDFSAIDGMQPRAVQWSERGGYIQKLMVLAVQVPLLKARQNGIAPLIHGTS